MKINKSALLLTILLLVSIVTVCAGTGKSISQSDKMIEPGEIIGNFVIGAGELGKFTYGISIDYSEPGADNTETCSATVGDVINVSRDS
jgi:hypothetical protein